MIKTQDIGPDYQVLLILIGRKKGSRNDRTKNSKRYYYPGKPGIDNTELKTQESLD